MTHLWSTCVRDCGKHAELGRGYGGISGDERNEITKRKKRLETYAQHGKNTQDKYLRLAGE